MIMNMMYDKYNKYSLICVEPDLTCSARNCCLVGWAMEFSADGR